MIGEKIGHFVVTEQLATGGAGTVYVGEHPLIGTKVAIKILRPELAAAPGMSERFLQEARASSRLDSPHLPRYHDFGSLPSGQPYAVMELLEGETLGDRLTRGMLPVAEAAEILAQLASVLELAHDLGLVHRDIKPDNVFLTRGPGGAQVVKLLDFGIAKAVTAPIGAHQTGYGIILGTPLYCAPEQAVGEAVGPVTDVYGLGVTAFEMLSGRLPFDGEITAVLGAKTCDDAPSLRTLRPELPDGVVETVAAMLARDPDDRPATMAEVRSAILSWLDDAPAAPIAEGTPPSIEHTPQRPSEAPVRPRAATAAPTLPGARGAPPTRRAQRTQRFGAASPRWWVLAGITAAALAFAGIAVRSRATGTAAPSSAATAAPPASGAPTAATAPRDEAAAAARPSGSAGVAVPATPLPAEAPAARPHTAAPQGRATPPNQPDDPEPARADHAAAGSATTPGSAAGPAPHAPGPTSPATPRPVIRPRRPGKDRAPGPRTPSSEPVIVNPFVEPAP